MPPIYFTFRSILKRQPPASHHRRIPTRTLFDATSKWVRDRGLDHAVEREKNLRPLINIKNLIKSEPSKSLPISIIAQNRESLMVPTRCIDFVRKYPTVFEEFLPGGVAVHPHVRLTDKVLDLDAEEELMYQSESYKQDVADRLLKLLMLVRTNKLPLNVIERLKWDLGLPHDYVKNLVPEFPDYFKIGDGKHSKSGSGVLGDLELVCWKSELAVSVYEKKAAVLEKKEKKMVFPMEFSRGFEMDKKMQKWVDEWQKLPYASPYENAAHLSSKSDESDKWAVAVLHELLHILVPKKTDRENVLCLGQIFGLRSRFKQALLNHPGIFYVSSKIGTYTVVLKEGYKRGVITENHQLIDMRSQYIHLMNMVKEDNKTVSVPEVTVAAGQGEEHENDQSDEEMDGEVSNSSDAEVGVDDDSDEEDEDRSQENAVNNRGRRAMISDFDGNVPSRNAGRERSDGRRARRSDFDGKAPFRNAERGRSDGRRARKSDFDVKPPFRNSERGRPDGRRARKTGYDVKAPFKNSERGRTGEQHTGRNRETVSMQTSRRTETDARHSLRQN